jgi:hypothetical protein
MGRSLDTPAARLLRLGLMLTGVAACAALGLETVLVVPDAASSPEPPHAERAVPPAMAVAGVDDAALVAQIAARPLFTPGRRPPQPPPEAPPVIAITKPEWNWRFAGLMIAPGRREALFLRGGEQRAVAEGEEIDGWTLASVRADGVTLEDSDGSRTLTPEAQPAKVPALRAAAANRAVMAAQLQQRQDIKAAEGILAAASRRMQAATARKPGRP